MARIIIIILVLSITMIACADRINSIYSQELGEDIVSASYTVSEDQVVVLFKQSLRILQLPDLTILKDYKIRKLEYDNLCCLGTSCWVVGGDVTSGFIQEVDITSGKIEQLNQGWYPEVYTVAAHDHILATGHSDGGIIVWDLVSGKILKKFGDYDIEVFSVAFSSDGNTLYTGNGLGNVSAWDVSSGEKIKSSGRIANSIFTLHYNGMSNTVACGGGDGNLCILDSKGLSVIRKVDLGHGAILSCDWRATDNKIVCGLTDGYVAIVNHNGTDKQVLKIDKKDILYVKFVKQGQKLITVSKDGLIKLWEAEIMGKAF